MKKLIVFALLVAPISLVGCGTPSDSEVDCNDNVQNGGEEGVDCGGPCRSCVDDPTCEDGVQNGSETGVDCGGTCASCATGPTCDDGISNGGETGIDCGGDCDPCPSSCDDGTQNGGETGIDCGGPCDPCPAEPTCSDGISNGGETGIDCGGSCDPCPACDDGVQNGGETGIDCGGTCDPCTAEPTCDDGIQNGSEEGVDCGSGCPDACLTCVDASEVQQTATLSCDVGVVASIEYAYYGLNEGTCGAFTNGSCGAEVGNLVEAECLDQASCTIDVNNNTFGSDPCPNQTKDLTAQYTCSDPVCAQASEVEQTATLSCDEGVILPVRYAYYGLNGGTCGAFTNGSCGAEVGNLVDAECAGKSSCTIDVNNNTFGSDPCPGQGKTLAVEYGCGTP